MSVSRDATSGRWMPANGSECTSLLSGTGLSNPSYLWLCQEGSGNLADSIGSCTLTAANSPTYSNTVSGWSAKAVGWTAGGTARFTNNSVPPNGNANSLALLVYQYVSADPSAYKFMASMTDFAIAIATNNSGGHLAGFDNGIGVGSEVITDGVVRPMLMVYNRAASSCKLYTPVDTIDCTYASSAGVNTTIGAVALTNPTGGCLFGCQWTGTAAEFTAGNAATILDRFWTSGPPSSGYQRGSSVNAGGLGTGAGRGRIVTL